MKRGDIEVIREGLKALAAKKFANYALLAAGANLAVDEYCEAKIAETELMANTVTSYSIQGRSITKRDLATIPWDDLTYNLLYYFDAAEIPFPLYGNSVTSIDFSRGAL